ncbi:enoyl-CoA hydratase/isomerase family protein [Micromonospora sp. NPDC002296]|uniref:enoyl-CoA hydratase/isomerase family protein n=1 Tax=Micromonospora sp. NPDC002296 TaxID=3154271 RepID=UPI00331BF345
MSAPLDLDVSRPPVVRMTMRAGVTRNRLDDELVAGLTAGLRRAERTAGAGVFVLDAVGDTFCAGMSLGDLDRIDWRPRITALADLFDRLRASPLVTVAVVDGATLGGGVGLAAACDHVIAGPGSRFRMTEVLLGLVPALVLPLVARRVGPHRAASLALSATELTGRDAERLGLADRSTEDPAEELRRFVVGLRRADRRAVRALKRYAHGGGTGSALRREDAWAVLEELLADPGVHRRVAAFREQGLIP